jgi:hypothetical protein
MDERPNLSMAARARQLRKTWLRRVTRKADEQPDDGEADGGTEQDEN